MDTAKQSRDEEKIEQLENIIERLVDQETAVLREEEELKKEVLDTFKAENEVENKLMKEKDSLAALGISR